MTNDQDHSQLIIRKNKKNVNYCTGLPRLYGMNTGHLYGLIDSKGKETENKMPSSKNKPKPSKGTTRGNTAVAPTPVINAKEGRHISRSNHESQLNKRPDKRGDVPRSTTDPIDVSLLTDNLAKMILENENSYYSGKRVSNQKNDGIENSAIMMAKKANALLDETQTQQIKRILVDCLQNMDRNLGETKRERPGAPETKTSLLRSYLSGSNPAREEYISKNSNMSNSLISSDSVHHSIFLESGRERRQCLLQYLSKVGNDGQVVIYVNSIPGAEALMTFLKKHGFQVNAVHPRLLLAESNWILSEFSLKKFAVLLCAEDHYHSCPAHFRWVKTIINYELPICNPTENWSIRNGIVEFSDNLPVHIYTFIKKSCPLDHELVKLLSLDSQQDQQLLPPP